MEHNTAVELIREGVESDSPSRWLELGAGRGTFTLALADLLAPGSSIVAIDSDGPALESVPDFLRQVRIEKHNLDFTRADLPPGMHGILLANALHFVPGQTDFLRRLKGCLAPGGRILIIEYDKNMASQWTPHPITAENLFKMSKEIGFHTFQRIRERRSEYGNWNIFSAVMY